MTLKAPFPWFGGKSKIAAEVWQRFGPTQNYVEPFAGSMAVLLARPFEPRIETVNDKDCFLANFWRAVQHDPEKTARYADWPVNEADLEARHLWLVTKGVDRLKKIKGDPEFYDCHVAGWWVWGLCCWIGSGWCQVMHNPAKQKPMLSKWFQGVNRNRPGLGGNGSGTGVHRKIPMLIRGGEPSAAALIEYFEAISGRLRRVRVCCGDWKRVMGHSVTTGHGVTGIFLDPPYSHAERDDNIYAIDTDCSTEVREWALAHGGNPLLRIALCGYDEEHKMPASWDMFAWKTNGGMGNQSKSGRGRDNAHRERIWFSPHCQRGQLSLPFKAQRRKSYVDPS